MERKRDHGLYAAKVHIDAAVVVSDIRGTQLFIIFRSSMGSQVFLSVIISAPDRSQAGGLGGHNVDTVAIIGCHR